MTTEERERLRALCDKATPGPWLARVKERWGEALVFTPDGSQTSDECDVCYINLERSTGDLRATAAFIAAARTALPELLDALEAAEASAAVMREALVEVGEEQIVDDSHNGCMSCWHVAPGHEPDCSVGLALATDAGTKMLAEVKRLREFVAIMRERRGCHRNDHTYEATDDMCHFCETAFICRALVALDAREVTDGSLV